MSFTSMQLAICVGGELVGDANIQCSGATIDSRDCTTGSVFFALQGEHVDGHNYVESAIDAGCSIAVVTREFDSSVPHVIVGNVHDALLKLAEYRRSAMDFDSVIAVTGSVGKTTVKDMLGVLLGDNAVVSARSFNNDLGVPLTILSAESAEYLVAEIGANDVGEIEPLANLVQPSIAIITSIGDAHLEGFGDKETVLSEKVKLLEALPEAGFAVVTEGIDLSSFNIQAKIITVGSSESASIKVETSVNSKGHAVLSMNNQEVSLPMLGEHNAHNAALAIVACSCAVPERAMDEWLERLKQVQSPQGRLYKTVVNGVTFIDDSYNANPTSMRSALALFKDIEAERKVLVLGDMLELGEHAHAEHRLLASAILDSDADVLFLVGECMKVTSEVVQSVYEESATDEALQRIASFIQLGDTVLLKGSRGMRLERIVENVRHTKVSNL
jgi:UDP-N-acetylmuramoyl-tripeptide--D-alanyl-D-alanine ligase